MPQSKGSPLSVEGGHRLRRVPVSGSRSLRGGLGDPAQFFGRQLDVRALCVLLEIAALLRPGDGDDVLALREHPGKRELRRRRALLLGDLLHALDEAEVLVEVRSLEARVVAPVIVLGQVLERLEAAGEEAAPERAVGDETDPQLAHGGEDLVLHVAAPEGVLRLQRRDRMHLVRAADGLRRRFREPEIADLPRLHQVRHRAHGFLDGHGLVDPVLVVEIDRLDPEPPERLFAALLDVVGLAVDAQELSVLGADVPELGREKYLVALSGDGSADQLFVLEWPVHVRRIEKGDTELERPVDGGDRLGVVAAGVELAHPHATEADRGDVHALLSQCARFHGRFFYYLAAPAASLTGWPPASPPSSRATTGCSSEGRRSRSPGRRCSRSPSSGSSTSSPGPRSLSASSGSSASCPSPPSPWAEASSPM